MSAVTELVSCVASRGVAALRSRLEEEGYLVLELEGSAAVDRSSFLAAVERDLPGEPGLRPHSWDGFFDVTRRGITGSGSDRVVVLWTSAHRMEERGLQDFLIAVGVFTDLLRNCYEMTPEGRFQLILAGDTPNFHD